MSTTSVRERRFSCRTFLLVLFLAALAPKDARADGLIIPHFGVNFGGDSGTELSNAFDAKRFNWGASFLFMGAGVFGIEGDFAYSPDFFGKTDLGGSSVFTATGNLLLGIPFGGQKGFGIRPYGLAGIGVMHPEGEAFDTLFEGENKVSWDFGGGVLLFFGSRAGIRGDIRYFRTFEALDVLGVELEDGPGDLDFTRGSLGFVFRF